MEGMISVLPNNNLPTGWTESCLALLLFMAKWMFTEIPQIAPYIVPSWQLLFVSYHYNLLVLSKARKPKLDARDNRLEEATAQGQSPPSCANAIAAATAQFSHFLDQNPTSLQCQPFKAALSALSNLICFKSCRSRRIISGLESSGNRCAIPSIPFKGVWLGARLIRLALSQGGAPQCVWPRHRDADSGTQRPRFRISPNWPSHAFQEPMQGQDVVARPRWPYSPR